MIITFDGRPGSGKTTCSEKVAKLLDLPVVSNFLPRRILHDFLEISAGDIKPGSDFWEILLELLIFHRMRVGSNRHPDNFVLDDGLFYVLFHYREHKDFDNILDFFLQSFSLSSVPPPDFSFYLYARSEWREERKIYRLLNRGKISFKNFKLEVADTLSDLDNEWVEFWQNMERRIPNFYAIDGMQPEEKVMADIVAILEKGGVVNGGCFLYT